MILQHGIKLNERSGEADLSKDMSGPEIPPELRRSWYVEGHIRFGVTSSVIMQRCLGQSDKGDEGLSSRGTKLNSIFITAETDWPEKFGSRGFHYPLNDKVSHLQWDCNNDDQERNPQDPKNVEVEKLTRADA
ncbi:hypothetical protein Tco_0843495 [Tanacetum coccineum]|uniref:Uncharacterized protein n=1 Tax=Tanacetum coccineum TaxID=301880 RepID=A0ABQ5B679_9ASTR